MSADAVRAYYATFGRREWDRLDRPEDGALEWIVHTRTIARYLAPGARVLDLGGGPDRYTIWLAEGGHCIVLADLSPELLAIARMKLETATDPSILGLATHLLYVGRKTDG